MSEIIDYLQSKGIHATQAGKEFKTDCIFCGETKKHLSINPVSGRYHCFKCNEGGNLWKMKKHFGDIKFAPFKEEKKKNVDFKKYLTLHENLFKDEDATTYLLRERGINRETIEHFKLGTDGDFISVPYFKEGKCVNIKYRSIRGKSFKREEGGESSLLNMGNIDRRQSLIITEGEFDCIVGWQIGFKNIVSISVGAQSINNEWFDFFDNFDSIYIAYDNDEEGEKGYLKLAQKLESRVFRVLFPQKDLNDCVMSGYTYEDLKKCIDEAKEYVHKDIIHINSVCQELEDEFYNGENLKGEQVDGWEGLNDHLGGIRTSEITSITGDTGTGKSTWCINLFYQFILKDKPVLFISSELPNKRILRKMYSMYSGLSFFDMDKTNFDKCTSLFTRKPMFFGSSCKDFFIDNIIDIIRYANRRYDVSYILIDHLHHFVKSSHDRRVSDLEEFMRRIKSIVMQEELHVFVIVHPHMLNNNIGRATMNDIKGASAIKQDSDNVISLWRPKDTAEGESTLDKKKKKSVKEMLTDPFINVSFEKVRDDSGHEGNCKMDFHKESQLYSEPEVF